MNNSSKADTLPMADSRPRRAGYWLWLLPVLAAIGAMTLAYTSCTARGVPIMIEFRHGHGLKSGDTLRFRGIEVGWVRAVRLADDFDAIEVDLRLDPSARDLARAGSRFWIVRPQLDLTGATGLDTLVGANYLRVVPGSGARQSRFTGLETPPVLETMPPGGLEIVLRATRKGNLRPGAPLRYREVVIGKVIGVALAPDASAVETHAYVEPPFVHLIREGSRFWMSGGVRVDGDLLRGLVLQVDSLETLITGGITLAIPPEPGPAVKPGHRFVLHEEPEPEWLRWTPNIALPSPVALTGSDRPHPLRAELTWKQNSLLMRWRSNRASGWILPVPGGFLGPADLLAPPPEAEPGSPRLTVEGRELAIHDGAVRHSTDLAFLPYEHEHSPWTRQRATRVPEDTLIVTDAASPARFVAASHLRQLDSSWEIVVEDSHSLAFTARWHGAPVLSATDGQLLGILIVNAEPSHVALLPAPSS